MSSLKRKCFWTRHLFLPCTRAFVIWNIFLKYGNTLVERFFTNQLLKNSKILRDRQNVPVPYCKVHLPEIRLKNCTIRIIWIQPHCLKQLKLNSTRIVNHEPAVQQIPSHQLSHTNSIFRTHPLKHDYFQDLVSGQSEIPQLTGRRKRLKK